MRYIFLFAFIVCVSSCQKVCYNCSGLVTDIRCIEGNYTIYSQVGGDKGLNDTLTYYTSRGFTCDTIYVYYNPLFYPDPVCGKSVEQIISNGNHCVEQ